MWPTSYILIRTYASPDCIAHDVQIVATGSEKALRETMARSIAEWQIDDLVREREYGEKVLTVKEKDFLKKNPSKLAKKWKDESRSEMKSQKNQRVLYGVYGDEGDFWSVCFTILPFEEGA